VDLVAIGLFRIVLRVASFRITEVIRDRKQDVEATDQCSSLTSGHQDPEVARYGITMTKVARKYEERKAENWIATGSRAMVEEVRKLKHLVSEDKGPMDVPSVCSSTVSVIGS